MISWQNGIAFQESIAVCIFILVNGSDLSEHCLAQLKEIICAHGTPEEVFLVRVLAPFGSRVRSILAPHKLDRAAQLSEAANSVYLSKIASELAKRGISIESVIVAGEPVKDIGRLAQRNNAKLIIVPITPGRHRKKTPRRWEDIIFGVMNTTSIPVCVASHEP